MTATLCISRIGWVNKIGNGSAISFLKVRLCLQN